MHDQFSEQTTSSGQKFAVTINPNAITRFLFGCIGLLLMAHLLAFTLDYVRHSGSRAAKNIIRWFDFNLENNVPTWFSVCLLTFSMLLLLLIYFHQRALRDSNSKRWLILSLIFLFLSVDEMVQVHEEIAHLLRPRLGPDSPTIFYWAWVIPYGIFVIVSAVYFLRFVLRLPSRTRNYFFMSGALFLTGALGLELVEGYLYVRYGLNHLSNRILYCMEELMEMGGVTLFIHALLHYIADQSIQLQIKQTHRG